MSSSKYQQIPFNATGPYSWSKYLSLCSLTFKDKLADKFEKVCKGATIDLKTENQTFGGTAMTGTVLKTSFGDKFGIQSKDFETLKIPTSPTEANYFQLSGRIESFNKEILTLESFPAGRPRPPAHPFLTPEYISANYGRVALMSPDYAFERCFRNRAFLYYAKLESKVETPSSDECQCVAKLNMQLTQQDEEPTILLVPKNKDTETQIEFDIEEDQSLHLIVPCFIFFSFSHTSVLIHWCSSISQHGLSYSLAPTSYSKTSRTPSISLPKFTSFHFLLLRNIIRIQVI